MNDNELKKVLDETLETNQVVDEAQSIVDEEASQEVPLEKDQDRNFKNIRKKLEAAEKERDEALRLAQQYDSYYRNSQQQQSQPIIDEEIGDDELIEARQFKKYKKQTQEELRQLRAEMQYATTEAKIKAKYTDFDDIVTSANLKRLTAQEPDIAKTLESSNDLYSKAITAYKMIKKLGISEDDSLEMDNLKVETNVKKPRTATSIAPNQNVTPLSRANAFNQPLTEELKDKLLAEMEEAIKNKPY